MAKHIKVSYLLSVVHKKGLMEIKPGGYFFRLVYARVFQTSFQSAIVNLKHIEKTL